MLLIIVIKIITQKARAIGYTYRTNKEGIRQLTAVLHPLGVEIITIPLPHYKGPSNVFHLMSILSPVDKDIKGGGGPTCLTRPIYRYK